MAEDMTGIDIKPTYQAALRLECGVTVRVTVAEGVLTLDARDDRGLARSSIILTRGEAQEVGHMMNAAERRFW